MSDKIRKLEDYTALEIAQHLADFVSDHCKRCSIMISTDHHMESPTPCMVDAKVEKCLATDEPGCFAKHNYSTDKRYDPMDFRHWNVSERMSIEELNEILRCNQ